MTAYSVKTILAAINNFDENRSLFKEALVLASSMQAKVVVVAVTPRYEGNMNRVFLDNAEESFKEPLIEVLKEAEEYASSLGLPLETVHRVGTPWEEICAVAYDIKADVVLLGCAKRMHMERLILGRTTAEVIQNSPCDVLIICEEGEVRFDRLLTNIDASTASSEAGTRAMSIAKSYGSEIHALYLTNISTEKSLRYGVTPEAELKAWKALKDFTAEAEKEDISVVTGVCGNMPEDCLAQYAREKDIHLIILGMKSSNFGIDILSGNIVERLVSKAPCPILVAKKK